MLSLFTNTFATLALRNLGLTQNSLSRTQAQISSGLRVADASDHASSSSIGVTMKPQVDTLSTVNAGLDLDEALFDVTTAGINDKPSRASINFIEHIPFRLLLGRVYDDKDLQEEIIRKSSLDWIIARPGILTSGPHTSKDNVLEKRGSWRNGIVSRADVTDFLIK